MDNYEGCEKLEAYNEWLDDASYLLRENQIYELDTLKEKLKAYDEWMDDMLYLVSERQKVLNSCPWSWTRFEKEIVAKMHQLKDIRGRREL